MHSCPCENEKISLNRPIEYRKAKSTATRAIWHWRECIVPFNNDHKKASWLGKKLTRKKNESTWTRSFTCHFNPRPTDKLIDQMLSQMKKKQVKTNWKLHENWEQKSTENRKSARNNLLAYLLTMRMKRKWIYDKQEKEGGQGNEWKITKWRKKQHFNAFIFFFAYSHHRLAIPIMVFMIHH